MNIIAILMGLSLLLGLLFLGLFIWNLNKGQFNDDFTPSLRILFDADQPEAPRENRKQPSKTKN
jgi:cbb3-type cytochrome oxidase maturation protein